MGTHASQQPAPRVGLGNLARLLFEQGALPDDSMQALGAFVADILGLSIAACMGWGQKPSGATRRFWPRTHPLWHRPEHNAVTP